MEKDLIKTARTLLGMSQQELAEKVGVNHSLISRIEAGDIQTKPENIEKISAVFTKAGIDFNVLFQLHKLMKH